MDYLHYILLGLLILSVVGVFVVYRYFAGVLDRQLQNSLRVEGELEQEIERLESIYLRPPILPENKVEIVEVRSNYRIPINDSFPPPMERIQRRLAEGIVVELLANNHIKFWETRESSGSYYPAIDKHALLKIIPPKYK